MEPIEERFLFAVLIIIGVFVFLIVFSRYKRDPKSSKNAPVSTLILVLLFMLALLSAQYSQFRTYTILSIVTMVVISIAPPLLISLMLWKFRETRLFTANDKITRTGKAFKLALVFISYILLLALINTGFSFLFNGIINPQAVALTPEFELYAIPVMSGLVLVVYRFTGIFGSKPTEILGKISEDIVIFSVSMSWLGIVASLLGIRIGGAPLDTSSALSIYVVGVALAALAIEGFIVKLKSDLTKIRGKFSLNEMVQSMFSEILAKKRIRQPTLEDFWKVAPSKPPSALRRLAAIIDKNFSFQYRGRVLQMSKLLTVLGLMVMLLASFESIVLIAPHEELVAASGYLIELSVTAQTQLPPNSIRIASEEVESLKPEQLYAIPIVLVEFSNGSFTGPLSRRLVSLNSTDFVVSETNNCLTIELRRISVETTVSASGLGETAYNQTGNTSFDYLGFFRDAEIYYALIKHGFNQTFTLSISSFRGETSIAQKILFASNNIGESALVIVDIHSDIFAIDTTTLTSANEDFLNEVTFLLQQTKLNTNIIKNVANATEPFHVLDLP